MVGIRINKTTLQKNKKWKRNPVRARVRVYSLCRFPKLIGEDEGRDLVLLEMTCSDVELDGCVSGVASDEDAGPFGGGGILGFGREESEASEDSQAQPVDDRLEESRVCQ